MFDPVRWPREAWVPLVERDRLEHRRRLGRGCPGACSRCCRARSCSARARACCSTPATAASRTSPRSARCSACCSRRSRSRSRASIALALAIASAASFLAAGYHALRLDAHPEGVPEPVPTRPPRGRGRRSTRRCSARWCSRSCFPSVEDHRRIEREVAIAREQFADAGWLEKPEGYHERPPDACARRHRAAPHARLRLRAPVVPRANTSRAPASPGASAGSATRPTAPRMPGSCAATRARPGWSACTATGWDSR